MRIEINKAHLALLFAILFITTGWIAPAAYASYAPQDHYIEVNKFSASNATTADNRHTICLDRNVKEPGSATVFTELYLVDDGDRRVEVDSRTMERYFQEGNVVVETEFPLPEHIEAGEYRYVLVAEMDLAQGRVTREFKFVSQTFHIAESDGASNETTKDYHC